MTVFGKGTARLRSFRTFLSYDRNVLNDLKRAVPFPNTVIQDYFNYRLKGCSKYYIPLLKRYIDDHNIRFPPALQNAVDAYFMDENDIHWDSGIKSVIKSVSSPKAIDTGFKIFLRQNWTPLKQSRRLRDPDAAACKLCDEPSANTMHMYIECPAAVKLWKLYNQTIKSSFGVTVNISPESILFHQYLPTGPKFRRISKVLTDTMLSIKKLIQNLNFRNNAEDDITDHEFRAIFYNSMMETIFSNKAINRLDDLYHILYQHLSNSYGYRKKIEYF